MAMINQNFRGAIANPSRFGGLQKIDNSKYTEESVCIRVETTELTGGLIEIDW